MISFLQDTRPVIVRSIVTLVLFVIILQSWMFYRNRLGVSLAFQTNVCDAYLARVDYHTERNEADLPPHKQNIENLRQECITYSEARYAHWDSFDVLWWQVYLTLYLYANLLAWILTYKRSGLPMRKVIEWLILIALITTISVHIRSLDIDLREPYPKPFVSPWTFSPYTGQYANDSDTTINSTEGYNFLGLLPGIDNF